MSRPILDFGQKYAMLTWENYTIIFDKVKVECGCILKIRSILKEDVTINYEDLPSNVKVFLAWITKTIFGLD